MPPNCESEVFLNKPTHDIVLLSKYRITTETKSQRISRLQNIELESIIVIVNRKVSETFRYELKYQRRTIKDFNSVLTDHQHQYSGKPGNDTQHIYKHVNSLS